VAHHTNIVKEFAENIGLEILFIPPTSSPLNPIERIWALFKFQFRRNLLSLSNTALTD
jgi:transposase